MPEGDTLHELALVLRTDLVGETVADARVEHQPVESLRGATIEAVFALGKHLFIESGERALRTHLGMHGAWHRYARGERWQRSKWTASCVVETGAGVHVCFSAREAELVDLRGHRHRAFLRRLGPDLLAEAFDAGEAVRRARRLVSGERPLCDVLLDQRAAAGIGNVYKNELLFLAGIAPLTRFAEVTDDELAGLYEEARGLLRRNLAPGPRRTRAETNGAQRPAGGEARLWVYGRAGEPCDRCGAPLRYARGGAHGRSLYWCPACQPARPAPRAG